MTPTTIVNRLVRSWYSEEEYNHVLRVAKSVEEDPRVKMGDHDDVIFCYNLALCHDLFTLTDIPHDAIEDDDLRDGIELLTPKANETYNEYCRRLSCRDSEYFLSPVEDSAWLVKVNEMKDLLRNADSLSDKLRLKYMEALYNLL